MTAALALLLLCAPPADDTALDYIVVDSPALPADALIVVGVHGLGDSAEGFSRFLRRLSLPVRFVVPNGPRKRGPRGFSWYRPRSSHAPADVALSTSKLNALLDVIKRRWPKAPKPFLVGFSQGGVMGLSMAAAHPQRVAGIVAIAGYLIPEAPKVTAAAKRPPILVVHGTADTVIPFTRAGEAQRFFKAAGYDISLFKHAGEHRIPPEAMAALRDWLARQISG